MGDNVLTFEKEFARYCSAKRCIGVNSGESALQLALLACDIGPGDEVITVPFTFIGTANAIIHIGAKPVFVDCELKTYNIDARLLKEAITSKTKAIIPVHLFGHPADMDPINEIADEHGLWVITDAAEAHGARYKGRMIGSLGHLSCFSFYPTKNITCLGDGGAVVTSVEDLAEKLLMFRDCGRSGSNRYEHAVIGYNKRMSEISAAILRVQLKHLDNWNDRRREVASRYREEIVGVVHPFEAPWAYHTYYLYVVRSDKRDELKGFLGKRAVETGIHFNPIHLQPCYMEMGFHEGMFSMSEKLHKEVLSLPMHANLTKEEVDYVIATTNSFTKSS
ncbi:MAG: aminotransferase class I/II-fold pyridoxal phosphate-dependent enzyme [Nitrososphaeria archaeon]|nr:aminotransferase class I/II-fold pyridoxal phosphate-dependent enzyme [Nitrososphaeria archaeon]NIQ33211.1 aminotransferase class I/II-fold pyridoxal phosphate-dependent enzyme [Nitrososphaeria archaeon]